MSSWYRLIRIVWYTHANVLFVHARWLFTSVILDSTDGCLHCICKLALCFVLLDGDCFSCIRDLRCSVFSLLNLTLQGFYNFSHHIKRKFHFRLWRVAPINCRWGRYSTILDSVLITMVFTQHLLFARPFGLCRGVFGRSTSLRVLIEYEARKQDVINLELWWNIPERSRVKTSLDKVPLITDYKKKRSRRESQHGKEKKNRR